MATTDLYTVSGDVLKTKHALRFLGGNVDDGVTVNALAAAITAGTHTKGTITAWVMIPNNYTAAMTIFSMGDNNVAGNFFHFTITTAGKLQALYDNGGVTQYNVATTNKVIYPWTWYHVAFVQDGISPKIYVNGVEQALTWTTTTAITGWYDADIDNGCIGALYSNNAYTQEFMGYIADFEVWSGTASTAALTASEVMQNFYGVHPNSSSMIAYYEFDGDVLDSQTGGTTYQGTIVGAIIYVQANEFFCRLTYGCGIPVTADNICMTVSQGVGHALVVQQA